MRFVWTLISHVPTSHSFDLGHFVLKLFIVCEVYGISVNAAQGIVYCTDTRKKHETTRLSESIQSISSENSGVNI